MFKTSKIHSKCANDGCIEGNGKHDWKTTRHHINIVQTSTAN